MAEAQNDTEVVSARMSSGEVQRIRLAAEVEGRSVSGLIADAVMPRARRALGASPSRDDERKRFRRD